MKPLTQTETPQGRDIAPGVLLITDDFAAKGILATTGLLQSLIETGKPYGHAVGLCPSNDRTCYVIGIYDDGHPDPRDNGYSVMLLDARVFTLATAIAFAERVREGTRSKDSDLEGVEVITWIPPLAHN